MARLNWGEAGTRYFESGVDRGVLYVNNIGHAWSGLISVSENPSGGEPRPYYIDGIKYLNVASSEEFEATIEAFSAPSAFDLCDGVRSIQNGLFVTQQPRRAFSFSYRTKVGNDSDGEDHGYKIHLVYNALAAPSDRENSTNGDSVSPTVFSWEITTLPPSLTGYRPTAHFVVDTRQTPPAVLTELEDILYGTALLTPTMPTVAALVSIFSS